MSKNKLQKKQIGRIVGWGSIGLLSILSIMLLYPLTSIPADAIDLTEGQGLAMAAMDTTVYIQPTISLALPNRLEMDIIPVATMKVNTATAELYVATNNSTGYGIYLGTANGKQTLDQAGGDNVISPLTSATALNSWTEFNTWGYQLAQTGIIPSTEESQYRAVPGNAMQVKNIPEVDPTGSKDTFNLSFGVAVNATQPAGAYNNQVVVSVVANPRAITNLEEATYMQDFDGTRNANGTTATSSKICEQSTVGMTKQLIDTRDGKKYWVAKLADNNCWMTQNLALDLTQGTVYTSADTDLAGNWTVPTSMETKVPTDGSNVTTSTRSWNMGEYVLVTPVNVAECTIASGQTFEKCPNFMEVSDLLPTMNEIVEGEWNGYSGPLSVNVTNNTYNSHYLIGRYYQWNTATAGSGGSMTSGNATNSICPGGWKLPTSQQIATQLSAYGITNNQVGTKKDENGIFYNIALAPLFYTRTGVVSTVNRNGAYMTLRGYSWSSTASAADSSYALLFDGATSVTSADKNYRYNGTTVRCVAR